MKITKHVPEPVKTTYTIEGITEREARVLLALVGSIGDTEGTYLVSRMTDAAAEVVEWNGRYGGPLRNVCESLYSGLGKALPSQL